VTCAEFIDVQPLAPETVREYVVVALGLAIGLQLFGSLSPVAGVQEQFAAPEPESSAEPPGQIVADPDATAIAGGTIVTTSSLDVMAGPKAGVVVSTR
jgi:hypothetical protein